MTWFDNLLLVTILSHTKKKLTEKKLSQMLELNIELNVVYLCSLMQKLFSALRAVHIYRNKGLGTSVL